MASRADGQPLPVNRVIIGLGDDRQLVYYWFAQRGRMLTNEYLVKWYIFWDALTRNRTDGALVRLTTFVDESDSGIAGRRQAPAGLRPRRGSEARLFPAPARRRAAAGEDGLMLTARPRAMLHLVAAARPNFMKVAPLWHALSAAPEFEPRIVHTGQHYDANMSDAFFADLGLPEPHFHLGVGSGTHAEQTGRVMMGYEKVCLEQRPDWTIVVGDVNSTAACALVCAKLLIPVAHLEAGLRSGDRTMPEEINRLVTDAIVDLLWTPVAGRRREPAPRGRAGVAHRAGRQHHARLLRAAARQDQRGRHRRRARPGGPALRRRDAAPAVQRGRPGDAARASSISSGPPRGPLTLVFPVHPRTAKQLREFGLHDELAGRPGHPARSSRWATCSS